MEAITLERKDNKLIISLQEGYVSQETITRLLDRLKLEHLIEKADFDESIVDLGEQIKAGWWEQNKKRYLRQAE